ncbi:DUF2779 domain-containing protein [Candidatus Pacearchaeota archaeon]|nr:DUF2779 domain-containing protein [Candidatus Pacearchaeota archaeon]
MPLLTKSKYLQGLQCSHLLWTSVNDKARLPDQDLATQYRLKSGNEVGEIAKKKFMGGIDISTNDFIGNIEQTSNLLKQRKPLFEAGFKARFVGDNEVYSRIDVLVPVEDNKWDIVEVKSGTRVKDINIDDVSFQKYSCEKSGLEIRNCYLMHINNQYIKQGEVDPEKLFVKEDITERVDKAISGIEKKINNMFEMISLDQAPKIRIGAHCQDPYDCVLKDDCWKDLPEENVFHLARGREISRELYNKGIIKIKDIPKTIELSYKQKIQKECAINGKIHIDTEAIKHFLSSLKYPLYYLDFETLAPAIPKFNGTRPYQQIPFQYSLHVQQEKEGETKHLEFLAEGTKDPRPELLKKLKRDINTTGDIVVYSKRFESGVVTDSINAFPEFKDWGKEVLGRMNDLLTPFREFYYYHPSQCGSASLKKVLPAVVGKTKAGKLNLPEGVRGYEDMDISHGLNASIEYQRVTYGSNIEPEERERVRTALKEYCKLDTLAEAEIISKLNSL